MITVVVIWVLLAALAVPLYLVGRSRYGYLHLLELAGFLCILLAGCEYRRAAAGILATRASAEAKAFEAMERTLR